MGNPKSRVETFVSLHLVSNDSRWQGVPITLSHGKALEERYARASVKFKDGSTLVFELAHRNGNHVNGYVDVYQGIIAGAHHLFTSTHEVLESWRILDAVQKSWLHADLSGTEDLIIYKQGSSLDSLK